MKPTFTRLGRLFVFVFFHCSLVLSAQIGPGIAPVSSPSGGFNIDGTLSSNSAIGDWVSGTGSGGFVLANSGTPLNIKTTYHLYDEYNSSTDNIFGGGDKVSDNPNSMSWTLGTANNKTDMNNALIHFTTDANGNVWFVFAADRLSNSGNAYIDFEFLQDKLTKTATGFASTGSSVTGGRTQGDFLLTVYFENGAANFDIQHWENVSGTWQYKTYFSSLPLNSVYAAGNSTTVPVPYSAFGTNSYPQNTFIESAVNLTEVLGAIDPCANLKIKTIFVKSKTSTAPSASIKDFFEPLAVTNLTLGSADAGDDDTICSGGNYKLQGVAVPSSNYTVVSTTWSVLSGSATIASPNTLDSYVTINGSSATLRLTVETHPSNGIGTHCIVYDDVTITTTPSPSCSITGSNGPLCPSTIANNYAAPVSSSYSWSISGNGTLSGSTTSQTASVTAGQNCNASFTLTLNTTDTNGCTSECTKTVAVNDTTSPIITTTSGTLNHTLQCNNTSGIASALMEVPTATDNCSATPTMHLVSDVTTPTTDCANGYSRVRTWNFNDGCGNTSANFVQTINVIDDIAPVVSTISETLNHTLQCNNASGIESALAEIPTATDNCSATPTMHLVSDVTTPTTDCANGYSRVRTWNFNDDCGNTSANFVQTITVVDDVAPIVTTTSGTLNHTLQCNNASGITAALMEVPTATDNCSATPTMHLVSDITTPTTDCANGYSRVRTWNFTDDCGNTSTNFVQTITVIDDVAPVVTTISGALNHTLQCDNASGIASALMEVPTATDNCSATPTMHLVSDVNTPTTDCANGYSRVRTWNFTDGCGNTSANFVQTITVIDDVAPIVTTTSGTLNHTLQCNNTSGIESALMEIPTAADNCSATPTIHLVSDVTTPTTDCANGYSRVKTWNFTDGCGNTSADFVQTIIVIDDVAPVVTTISGALNHTLQCNNTNGIESALAEIPTATDNCSATPTIHLVSDVTTPTTDCANGYSRVRTWNFTDDCGNTSANFVQTITVIDDVAPIVTTTSGTLNHTLQCDNASGIASSLMEVPTATDNCSATPTMHLVSDVTTPTTDCANGYSRARTWNFTDDCGNTSANFVQTITVIDDVAPIVTTTSGALNHTLQCNNTSGIESALMEIPTATDNCSATPTMHLVSDITTPTTDCANGYSRARTWNFTDDCGNTSANFVQTITVIDDVAPVVTTTSGTLNHTLQCNNASGIESALAEIPTATDNCSATPTIHLVSDVTTPTTDCANGYSRVRTWNFNDGCGNTSANFVQTITVIDDVAPVVTTTSGTLNHTLQCNNASGIESALMEVPTATDNCSATPTMHLVSDITTPTTDCANGYSRVRTWNFTDGCGNTSDNFVQEIIVQDTIAPTFVETVPNNTTVECNTIPIPATLTAIDNCSEAIVVFSESELPGSCPGSYTINRTWTATDSCGNQNSHTQIITVKDTTAPTFIAPVDITLTSDSNCYADISTTSTGIVTDIKDNCDPNPITSYENSDCFGNFNSASVNSGTGNYFPFTVSGFDSITANNIKKVALAFETNQGKGRAEFVLVAPNGQGIVLVAPYCKGGDCDNLTSSEKELYLPVFYPNSSNYPKWDNSNPIVTNSIQNFTPNGVLSTTNTITGLSSLVSSFEEFTGDLNGNWFVFARKDGTEEGRIEFNSICLTPSTNLCGSNTIIVRKWSVSDACSNTVTFNQIIKIVDTTAPTWITEVESLNTSIECSDEQALANAQNLFPIASDNCDKNLNIVKVAGEFVASSTCATTGNYTNTWTVTDSCGNTSANFVQTITVIDDVAPVVSTISGTLNHTLQCNNASGIESALMDVPTATDNCSATPTMHLVSDITTPTTDCTNGYSRVRTWNFTDDCGNTSANFVQTITIIDDVAPVVTTISDALNHTLQCDDANGIESALAEIPTAADNCSATPTIHLVSDVTTPTTDCANGYSRVRTWNFTDGCGNTSANYVQEIIVQDTIAPIWITQVGSLNTTIECNDAQALANAQNSFPIASDNCDTTLNNIKKTAGEFVASSTCTNSGTYTNTWTVTDDCGNNSETFTQVITIQDSESPKMITKATDIVVECDGQGNQNAITNWLATNGGAIASDNCSEIIWTNNFNSIANDCSAAVTVVFTATDTCGNSTSTSGTFSVQDNTPPTVPDSPASITIGCAAEIPEMISLTANDNCSGNITVEGINTIELGDCDATYTIKRTWTFRDACNNISTVSQTINVVDTTAPTIAQLPEPSTISCPNTPVFAQATATDECGLNFSLTFKDVKTEGNCAGSYSFTRTWTAADSCGNSTTASQTITVQDTTGPVFSSLPEPTTISCPNTPVFAFATATDECGSDFSLTFNDVKTEGNCAGSYSITRTWTATDTCGNSATASQTITVEDTTGPITTTEFSTNTTANCDAIPAKPELVFVDACSTVLPASFSETISNLTADSYVINRKWIVSDSCGNASEFIQTINVTITNSLTSLSGTICNDGETTSIDLTSLFPVGTPTNGTWTDVSNTGKLVGNTFNAASLSVGDYLFEYIINDSNCPRTIRITMSVTTGCGGIVLPCGTIVVHNAFSPNGDGINEKFVIDNINDTNCYPDNTVEIYNRWGVLVYSTKGYNNTTNAFDGISDGRSTVSQSSGLPAGTYFYILMYTSFDNNNVIQTNKKEGYLFLTK